MTMWKNLPIILLGIALVVIVVVSDKHSSADSGAPRLVSPQTDASQSAQDANRSNQVPAWRMILAWPQGVTALAVLLTLFFIAWQALLMRQSVTASDNVSKRELRAYVTVVIGQATFQERRDEDKGGDLKFDCRPLLVNTGRTPARKITYKARAAIMAVPLPKGTHLPEDPDEGIGGSILGPQQNANMFAVVDGFCADKDVDSIKYSKGDKGLYVWGRVTYEDVFGENHYTRFCHLIYWSSPSDVKGHYIPGRNDAD
jgi:hypothetical protein